jgi:hypothetical protein
VRRPNYAFDLATVHLAMFDAVAAIDGSYQHFAAQPTTAAAAYHALRRGAAAA